MARKPRPGKSPPAPQGVPIAEAIDMAHRHWEAGQAVEAEHLCRRVLEVWPGQPDVLHLLGLIAHAFDQPDVAIDHMRQACAHPQAPADYFSNLGELCRRRNRLDEAEQATRQAVARDASQATFWSNLGIILQEAGKLEGSARCLERAAALDPGTPECQNNLGNTRRLLGRLAEAASHYDKALTLDPHYVDACCNLGNLRAAFGQPDQGLALFRRAIGIAPRMADAYLNAAALEGDRERWVEAFGWLEALRDFAPDHPRLPAARARTLLALGRAEEALAIVDAVLAAGPGDAPALLVRGMALQTLERFDEALDAFAALGGAPGPAAEGGLVNRGALLTELGRLDEARTVFIEARRRFPRSPAAWYGGLELIASDPGDPARLEDLLRDQSPLPHRDRTIWHFTLGKAWMEAGDTERAFEHIHQGNRLKRAAVTYDADATDAWFAEIAHAFPKDLFRLNAPTDPDPSELPVFVIGMPRSGTSLVEQILASHPAVLGAGELRTLQRILEGIVTPGGQPVAFPNLMRTVAPQDLAAIGRLYLDRVSGKAGDARRLIDKMPTNFLYAGLIALILPGARIIHCHRDPLDCCLSNYARLFLEQNLFTYDMTELGRFYRAYERLMAHWRKVLPPGRLLDLRYEDLVEDPEGQSRRLVEFCGLPWDSACLDFHRTARPVATASAVQVRRPIFREGMGRAAASATHLAPLIAALEGGSGR
ncbi:tetratricopeptide repeat-containing sulfotransferase family protein [Azospirillum doebereinerae]|uniref:Tetratricopeptide repeat protein n=1 Tax=Azospirillum doebereinerae TaxID=92933 RepID=A0A433IZ69_9PROT|nr:sulfotransferase [Azospirillum doebereinerae]MCG5244097.1 sulfotransferase [Azospirillum doebereinerae]RUQ59819.1 tetratricopeptide repeat protein [Azospirillum doebereinerae]